MSGTGGVPADAELGIAGFTDAVEIGRGSFGVVYRAHQAAEDRDVAIKVLTSSRDAAAKNRFERERQVLSALSGHPAIVTVIDSGYTDTGQAFVVMELMAAGSLGERVSATGPLLWPQAVEIGIGIAGGLEVAHRMGVLHRDVKPDNLLVSAHNDVKLADFGVATFVGGASSRTWSVIASVAYAAPEVLGGQRSTVMSDVYGLAATVFALLYGRAPFARTADDSIVPMVTRILNDRPPDLRGHGVPDEVCAALEHAMARNPADRFESAAAFGAALQDAQRAVGRPVTPMVVDANLSTLPPHELVTAVAPPPAPANGAAAAGAGADATATRSGWSPLATQPLVAAAASAAGAVASPDASAPPEVPATPEAPGSPEPPTDDTDDTDETREPDEAPTVVDAPEPAATEPVHVAAAVARPPEFFDAGPVLADLVTGPESRGRTSRHRVLAAVVIGALIALGGGAVAVALVRNDDNSAKTTVPTKPSVSPSSIREASTAPPTTEPSTTAPTTPTTVVTVPPTQATQPTTPPPPPSTAAAGRNVPTVSISGPSTIEDNVDYVWRTQSSRATSGQWSLAAGPPIALTSAVWRPNYGFTMRAGCNAVGSTYQLTLSVQGPGGASSATLPVRVIDTNGSCS